MWYGWNIGHCVLHVILIISYNKYNKSIIYDSLIEGCRLLKLLIFDCVLRSYTRRRQSKSCQRWSHPRLRCVTSNFRILQHGSMQAFTVFTVFTAFASRLRKRWLWNLEASSESRRVKFATGSGQRHPSDQTRFLHFSFGRSAKWWEHTGTTSFKIIYCL